MSRAYLLLIGLLVLVALGIGGFAYYRSVTRSQIAPATPAYQPSTPTPAAAATPTPTTQNQISLSVSSPTKDQAVSSATLTVSGKTIPNADVSVNEKDLKASANGSFSTTITLEEGENVVFITASDNLGNYSEWETTVTYTPAQ